ncbi:hypothetical protein [Kiloniella antarctica]|uniref:Uncharacterized protein n=1 Tax=Kiloniella antarctica TaxID=1550907 RepID=A0ABW5BHS1_9PROT
MVGEIIGSILKHVILEFVFEGLWKIVCLLAKGWTYIWISFYNLFLFHKPELTKTLGIISALLVNPITLCLVIGFWPDIVTIVAGADMENIH